MTKISFPDWNVTSLQSLICFRAIMSAESFRLLPAEQQYNASIVIHLKVLHVIRWLVRLFLLALEGVVGTPVVEVMAKAGYEHGYSLSIC